MGGFGLEMEMLVQGNKLCSPWNIFHMARSDRVEDNA